MTEKDKANLHRAISIIASSDTNTFSDALQLVEKEIGKDDTASLLKLTLFEALNTITIADLAAMDKEQNS